MIALPTLDPLLHQPVRTQIAAYVAGRGEATFAELKRALAALSRNECDRDAWKRPQQLTVHRH